MFLLQIYTTNYLWDCVDCFCAIFFFRLFVCLFVWLFWAHILARQSFLCFMWHSHTHTPITIRTLLYTIETYLNKLNNISICHILLHNRSIYRHLATHTHPAAWSPSFHSQFFYIIHTYMCVFFFQFLWWLRGFSFLCIPRTHTHTFISS